MVNSSLLRTLKPIIKELSHSFYLLRRNRLTTIALYIIFVLIIVAIIAPIVYPSVWGTGTGSSSNEKLLAPSREHPFGTDELGRDIFKRVLLGTRISLTAATITVTFSILIGVSLGATAGYFGGVVDEVIMRFTDMFMAFPPLLLAMLIASFLGPSLQNAIIATAVSTWPSHARLVRGQAVSVREKQFIKASTALGASPTHIIIKHIIPNCMGPVIVKASMDYGGVILTIAGLSFLGLGAKAPTPEWGLMVSTSRSYFLNAWWYAVFPGFAVFIAVLCFNLLGDGLREILDPKTRKN